MREQSNCRKMNQQEFFHTDKNSTNILTEDKSKKLQKEGDDCKKEVAVRTFKVIVIGDSNVGKTCLTLRACAGKFPERTEATIGVDFKEKKIIIGEEDIKLQLWDSAGQERFRYSLVPHYYRNVHAVIFVYDVTRKSSFDNLQKWLDEFHCNVGSVRYIPQLIIGNKCDLHADREVRTSEAKALANSYGLPIWETSAKSDLEVDTIESIFQSLGETLKLKTPLLEFPPHYSSVIKFQSQKGLRVNESLSASSESLPRRQKKAFQRKSFKKKEGNEKHNCCKVG
ncbi:putative Ras-related protein Rab-33 [Hydractinia symbiolongicarpus]|uniref:putative Ras-related protein Rab-33 n=1 Tax=Hydractinia symbiolongicarpus TaxID=13093 RepID=UPI00254F1C5C|nr:putative Ras-related protein Rab-33 [Hydractinia symbiolongicarpus]